MLGVFRSRLRRDGAEAFTRNFYVKSGYVVRERPAYFQDDLPDTVGVVHQPDVYPFAAHLARLFGCRHVLDIGCGRAYIWVNVCIDHRAADGDAGGRLLAALEEGFASLG